MVVFDKPKSLADISMHYCPGCTHGIVHRLVAEVIDELGIEGRTIGIAPVGCSVMAYNYFNCDMIEAAHGRAPAVATGVKRANPEEHIVFTYQGDGDLASIGMAETVHAAARNENITIIFINNAIYGMTGGQMAPTTLLGQKTTTSPMGRTPEFHGQPIKVAEIFAQIPSAYYVARVSVHSPAAIRNAKKVLKQAFQYQLEGRGFTFVEFLSTCPVNWGLTPVKALSWLEENMLPYYELGIKKDLGGENK